MAAATAPSEVCRCCLAPGAPGKDLSCQYDWMGEKEVYADMLLESFDITLSRAAAAGWVICEVCVSRLRDSTNFKKQVLHAERFLLQRLGAALEPTAKSGGVDMKVERLKAESAESDDDDAREHQFETHFCDDEDEMKDVSVKFEPGASTSNTEMSNDEDVPLSALSAGAKRKAPNLEAAAAKWPKLTIKPVKNPPKTTAKPKSAASKTAAKTVKTAITKVTAANLSKERIARKQTAQTLLARLSARPIKITVKSSASEAVKKGANAGQNASVNKPSVSSLLEMMEKNSKPTKKQRDDMSKANSAVILECTTVCPFKWSVRSGYCCFFCEAPFHEGEPLREHTRSAHVRDKVRSLIRQMPKEEMIKLDVTTIGCKICQTPAADLDALKLHLTDVHGKKFYADVNDGVLQFKLATGSFDCMMCSATFRAFHMLNQHMNKHFENYVCETCGVGFVTQCRLTVHQNVHKTGEFKCALCDKVFESYSSRTNHLANAHSSRDRFKCPQCPERFVYYHQRQRHLIKMHNEKHLQYSCKACGKLFMRKWHLTQHLRKDSCV